MKLSKILISIAIIQSLSAQDLEFDGKIQLVAPKRSSWTIKFMPTKAMRIEERKKEQVAQIEEMPLSLDTKIKTLTSVHVEKSGTLYTELSHYSDGSKTEKWMLGSLQFYEIEQDGKLATPNASLLDTGYSDRSQEDFEELGWLNKKFYKGVIQFNGEKCFLFETTTDKAPETRRQKAMREFTGEFEKNALYFNKEKQDKNGKKAKENKVEKTYSLPITVIISASTRLPLLYNDGNIIRTYKYQNNNLGSITPPDKFMREFKLVEEHTKKMKSMVIPP